MASGSSSPKPHLAIGVLVGLASLTLSGCVVVSAPPNVTDAKPTGSATVSASPTPEEPTPSEHTETPPTLEPDPTSVTSAPPTTEKPKVPPTSQAGKPQQTSKVLDVSRFGSVAFSSPSGRIVCSLDDTSAYCYLPPGFRGKTPSPGRVCGDPDFVVNAVYVEGRKADWMCFNDVSFWPSRDREWSDMVEWHSSTGFPWVNSGFGDGKQKLASLPYGWTLRHKGASCSSNNDGVRCWIHKTGRKFHVRLAGATFS